MLYLSRLTLDPVARRVQKELAQPYEMHRTLCHAFPNLSTQEWEAARVLFRADESNRALSLLVQSKVEPNWSTFTEHLNAQRYMIMPPQIKAWNPEFREGQSLRYRLQANPTMALNVGKEQKRGARHGLYREVERLDWLRSQSERCGFRLPTYQGILRANESEPLIFRGRQHTADLELELPITQLQDLNDGRRFPIPQRTNQFSAARFDGELVVTDSDRFREAVCNGIGKARGFGFGLLSVAPATS